MITSFEKQCLHFLVPCVVITSFEKQCLHFLVPCVVITSIEKAFITLYLRLWLYYQVEVLILPTSYACATLEI